MLSKRGLYFWHQHFVLEWLPLGSFSMVNTSRYKYHANHDLIGYWPNFPPPDHPKCGFDGELCPDEKKKDKDNCKMQFFILYPGWDFQS